MDRFTLNESGYIVNWLVTEPSEELYHPDFFLKNQLQFEKQLRGIIADSDLKEAPAYESVKLGSVAFADKKWTYYEGGNNWFLDLSKFYRLLTRVEFYAATVLVAPEDMTVKARAWTYEAVALWLNGEQILEIKEPVYKPIKYGDVELKLKKGKNYLFARLQDLGVRDTRNIFGLQIQEQRDKLSVLLPDEENSLPLMQAEKWLLGVTRKNDTFIAASAPVCPLTVGDKVWNEGTSFAYPTKDSMVSLQMDVNGTVLTRVIELPENDAPIYTPTKDVEEVRKLVLRKLNQAHPDGSVNHVLAHLYCGIENDRDWEVLDKVLDRVDSREDCSDFLLAVILRMVRFYGERIPAASMAKIKQVALNFRYWMDEDGADGMCFWSENHALLFYANELAAGVLFPDEHFVRSNRSGKEQYEMGRQRCREWLESVSSTGFEEFLAPGYVCITAAALMTVIDFADDDTSAWACRVFDRQFDMLSMHTFDGVIIGPRGRVYRDIIHPHKQEVEGQLHFVNPATPDAYTAWAGSFLTSKYTPKADLPAKMAADADAVYPNGNTNISIYKKHDYILSSIASPRPDDFTGGWESEVAGQADPYVDGKFTFMYVKALNERYHGTTLFQPGVFGYQQHLWSAALSNTCHVFTNLPGGTFDRSGMRPGYWYGNGLFPAIAQKKNVLGAVYVIDKDYPIDFTHVYFPQKEFDSWEQDGHWLFGKKGTGMLALWCSGELTPFNDMLLDSEFRCLGAKQAYFCVCSSEDEQDYAAFKAKAKAMNPTFDEQAQTLSDADGFSVHFKKYYNDTQRI